MKNKLLIESLKLFIDVKQELDKEDKNNSVKKAKELLEKVLIDKFLQTKFKVNSNLSENISVKFLNNYEFYLNEFINDNDVITPQIFSDIHEKLTAVTSENFDEFVKIFKKKQNKLNKKQGAYYTDNEIVKFMCQQSLLNYLQTKAEENDIKISTKDFEELLKYNVSDTLKQYAKEIDKWLSEITICDPAVGAGAFPIGMLQEIVTMRHLLNTNKTVYEFKKECIENSLYGIDIDSGAVKITKIRLWLALLVDATEFIAFDNLNYNIVCGDALTGEVKNV